jgi:hypothetical protein
VSLAFSVDGQTWEPTATHAGAEPGLLRVTTEDDPRFASVTEFWLRLELSGAAGTDDDPPVRLDDLRIEADLQLPKEKEVRLNPVPDAPGQFRYEDDFQTQKYLHTAEVTHGEWLDWSRGQVSMHGDAPGRREVTLTWRVLAPEPLRNVQVVAETRANPVHLGANNTLSASVDNEHWTEPLSTATLETDVNGNTHGPLTLDLSPPAGGDGVKEFWVRFTLINTSGVRTGTSNVLSRLTISGTT